MNKSNYLKMASRILSFCLVLGFVFLCSFRPFTKKQNTNFNPTNKKVIRKTDTTLFQEGVASYYAKRFQNRLTASGEPYDSILFTAAHKTLPFHTIVTVVNEANGKHVNVRINDRGPYAHRKVIDLSKAAAKKIGLTRKRGITNVQLYIQESNDH